MADYPDDFGTTPSAGPPPAPAPPAQPSAMSTGSDDFGTTPVAPSARAAPPRAQHVLDNSGADDPNGVLKNAATGLLRMPTHVPGAVGEGRDFSRYIGSNIASILPGENRTAQQIRDEIKLNADIQASRHGSSSLVQRGITAARKALEDAPTGDDLYKEHVEPRVGAYKPTTFAGRVGQAGLESMTLGVGGKGRALATATEILTTPQKILKPIQRAATSVPAVGGAMGATAQAVGEATDSVGAGMGASFAVPLIFGRLRPRPGARDRAADTLHETTHDPDAALKNFTPTGEAGSPLTLAEATKDPNLAHLEKRHGNENTDFGTRVNEVRGQQAQNREAVLGTMSPNGDPIALPDQAKALAARLHADALADTGNAQQRVTNAQSGMPLPDKQNPEALGKPVLDVARKNNERAQAAVSKLYQSLDPDGKIHLPSADARAAAAEIRAAHDPRVHPDSAAVTDTLNMIDTWPETMPYGRLVDFDKTIGQRAWQLREAGDHHNAGVLRDLQKRLETMRDTALEQHAQHEAGAVARGELHPDATTNAALQRQLAALDERAAAAATNATTASGAPQSGQPNVGAAVSTGATGPGPGGPGGSQGVPGNALGDAERAELAATLKEAKKGHSDRLKLFEESAPGKFITDPTANAGLIPGQAFPAGPGGAALTRQWLATGLNNPAMLEGIKDMALNQLRVMSPDGTVTPKILEQWKAKYGPALSEIDKHEPGFSGRFDEHAAAHHNLVETAAAVAEKQKTFGQSQLARFLNMQTPQEATAYVGGLMNRADGPPKLRQLMGELSPDGQAAVQRSVADWLVDQGQSRERLIGPGGASIKGPAPGNYLAALERAQPHLEAVFPQGYDAAKKVAAEMERSKQMIDAKLTRGGSDTVKNAAAFLADVDRRGTGDLSAAQGLMLWDAMREGASGVLNRDPAGIGRAAMMLVGRSGLSRISNWWAQRTGEQLRTQADLIRAALLDPEMGKALLEHGAARAADKTTRGTSLPFVLGTENERREREGRATGGSVKIDHAAHAARLVRMVATARNETSKSTEPMLKLPDATVSRALAIANERLA